MKLLLIRPNSSIHATPPPLGLLYLAAYLRRHGSGYEITVLDARQKDMADIDMERYVASLQPDCVGISGLHADAVHVHQAASLVKRMSPRSLVVIGGPYPTGDYARALQDPAVDYCVVGEGERSFFQLLEAIRRGTPFAGKGIARRSAETVIYDGPQEPLEDLDNLPFPAWELIDLKEYFYGAKRGVENPVQISREAVPILTSRGCPFGCVYCHDIFGKRFRGRSARNIYEEITHLMEKHQVKEIEIIDDTFNFDRKRLLEFCDLIVRNRISIHICFSNGIRADMVDREVLAKLKSAGVYRINYGIETASPRLQKLIGKNLDLDHAKSMIEETVRQGMMCGAFFMLGFPEETAEEMRATVQFAVRSRLHTAVFSLVTPYPGSRLHARAASRQDAISFSTVGKIACNMSAIPDEHLKRLRIDAYRRFYFDPQRWWRIFFRVSNKRALFSNFVEVVRVAFFKKELFG